VFKVVGVKNTKMKSKAKPVNSQLKRINVLNKSKIQEMDKQLIDLQDKVRKDSTDKKDIKKLTTTPVAKSQKSEKDYITMQQKSQETISELNQMQL